MTRKLTDRIRATAEKVPEEVCATFRQNPVSSSFHSLFGLFVLVMIGWLFAWIDRGIEFSDSGYYLLLLSEPGYFKWSVTHFGTVWNAVVISDHVVFNRVVHAALLIGISVAMMDSLVRFVSAQTPVGARRRIIVAVAAAGSAAVYFYYWLPDPSYNSIASILMMALAIPGLELAKTASQSWRKTLLLAGAAGSMALALSLTRAPSALFMTLPLAITILAVARPSIERLMQIVCGGLLGSVALIAFLTLRGHPPHELWTQLDTGYSLLIDHERPIDLQVDWLQDNVMLGLRAVWPAILAVCLGLASFRAGTKNWRTVGTTLTLVGLCLPLLLTQFLPLAGQSQAHAFATFMLATGLLSGLVIVVIGSVSTPPPEYLRLLFASLIVLALPVAQTAFTSNSWYEHSGTTSAGWLLALILAGSVLERHRNGSITVVTTILAGAILTIANHASSQPYRLTGELADQTTRSPLGPDGNRLRTDPVTARFLAEIGSVSVPPGSDGEPPVLIDLSGRFPLLHYHLDFRPPRHPWPASGYAGSQSVFDGVLADLADTEIREAWVLVAPQSPLTHDWDPLIARGLDPDRDYERVLESYSPYLDTQVWLLRPRNSSASDRNGR